MLDIYILAQSIVLLEDWISETIFGDLIGKVNLVLFCLLTSNI